MFALKTAELISCGKEMQLFATTFIVVFLLAAPPAAVAAIAPASLRSFIELLAIALVTLVGWVLWRRNAVRNRERERQVADLIAERTQKLNAEKEQIKVVSCLKSQFVSNINHEIRTPMNGILGGLELTLQTDLTAAQREYLELSKTSAESLMATLDDILEFSRTELDKVEIQRCAFGLGACVHGAVSVLKSAATQKGLTLRTDLGRDLPDRVSGDSIRLHQVLVKLVDNAVKFSSQGEIVVSVYRDALKTPEPDSDDGSLSLLFCVQDAGIGIPRDKSIAIFEPFRQVDGKLARRFAGVGLGLTICKSLVRLLGGRIWVESEVGHGSRFFFTAKFGVAAQASLDESTAVALPQNGKSHGKRTQVLIVEDNHVNQLVALRLLEKRGYYCLVAANGREALSIFSEAAIDLVLMDVQMPEMDGYEATRSMREIEKKSGTHVPILAMTAHATSRDRDACLRAGMDGHIAKPVQSSRLYAAIDAILV